MSGRPKITSLSLDPDVAAYLEQLGKKADRSRSWLINSIIRTHAQQDQDEQLRAILWPLEMKSAATQAKRSRRRTS
jgi:predicted transcriptional regulator